MFAGLAVAGFALPASAQPLIPSTFFNSPVDPAAPTAVEAQELVFDQTTNTITARGNVVVRADGYILTGQTLVYRRTEGDLRMTGGTTLTDPGGSISRSPTLTVTGGLRKAFLDSLAITASNGALITANSADYNDAVQTVLVNATYAPCGECIDDKGRRIGWSMQAKRVTQNRDDGSTELEQPTLSLLGIPVAWLPYLWLPKLDYDTLEKLPRPTVSYQANYGVKVEAPFSVYSTNFTDIILSPTLVTRQGFLLSAEWVQRFDNGSFYVKGSGLYQLDKYAFTFADAQRDWRGAVQTAGEFVPVKDWKLGFAYSVMTDNAFFKDYDINPRQSAVNEVYATNLTSDTYIDARLQQFNVLGDNTSQVRDQQGAALPNIRIEKRFTLPPGAGQIDVEGRLLGISRISDYATKVNGVPYDIGYAGNRMHAMGQASWQSQWIVGGAVATPFLGVRLDGAYYDGKSSLASAPAEQTLFGATPIAALDVRYPLAAYGNGVTHLIEPIAQMVYRGSSAVLPGITNEDSQSAVFDDTNLFSYNRFTGIDRQETGLRLNVGGRYLATLDSGSYVELVGGQSFQLADINAFAVPNAQQVGVGSGLETNASYTVLGAYGMIEDTLKAGGKLQVDSSDFHIARASLGASYGQDGWAAALNYRYARLVPATGNLRDLHEAGVELTVPVDDYWSVSSNAYWDISANSFLQAGGALTYNDGYLVVSGGATRTGPTHTSPNDTRFTATFQLLPPAGKTTASGQTMAVNK